MHWIKLGNSYENLSNVTRVVKEYNEEDEVTLLRVESTDVSWVVREPEQMEKALRSLDALCVGDVEPESRPKGEPAILRLELKPPHSGVGVLANKSFQSRITLEAAKSALQSIYQLALEYGWKMDQPADVFLGDLLRRYVK